MNKARRTAHMYELGMGYKSAHDLEERRRYGSFVPSHAGGRFKVHKKRWYHRVWDWFEELFAPSGPTKEQEREARKSGGRGKVSSKAQAATQKSFHSRRT